MNLCNATFSRAANPIDKDIDELLQNCDSRILVPVSPIEQCLNICEDFQGPNSDVEDLLSRIPQRSLLIAGEYEDEQVDLYIVITVPYGVNEVLDNILPRLNINFDAYTEYEGDLQESDYRESKAVEEKDQNGCFYSCVIAGTDNPRVFSGETAIYVLWKVELHLDLPRATRGSYHVYFVSAVKWDSPKNLENLNRNEAYLRSGTPLPSNVLHLLSHDSDLREALPYMPLSRIIYHSQLITGTNSPQNCVTSVKSCRFRGLSILNPHFTLIRRSSDYTKQILLLSVELVVPLVPEIEELSVTFNLSIIRGVVQQITYTPDGDITTRVKPGDCVVLLYEMKMMDIVTDNSYKQFKDRICDAIISASVAMSKGHKAQALLDCKEGVLDAFRRANSSEQLLQSPAKDSIQRRTHKKVFSTNLQSIHSVGELGITITISGPQIVRVREEFTWSILVVNKTNTARKCAITLLQDRFRENYPESNSFGHIFSENLQGMGDENILESAESPKVRGAERSDVLCLSPNTSTKPLTPLGCFDTSLNLLPLQPGYCQPGTLCVVDEITREIGIIKILPDVIAISAK